MSLQKVSDTNFLSFSVHHMYEKVKFLDEKHKFVQVKDI